MSKRSIDSIFQTRSITTKEAGTSFNTSPKNNNNNKKRKSLSSFFSSFHITKPSLQKLSSIYLIITVLFQSMAGLFLFSPVPQAKAAISWYNTSYSYRKQITIDRTKIPHTDTNNTNPYLTDFPILVSTTDNNLKSTTNGGKVQKEDGSDIIFASQNGTELLNYEIESYDNTTGTINAWVKIPQLNDINNTQNTVIYMYYGNSSAAGNTEANIHGVWDDNFKAVWHLGETGAGTAGDYKDSTVNANNSVNTNYQPVVVTGRIGKGQSFDGADDYVSCGNNSSLNLTGAMSFGGWVRISDLADSNILFGKGSGLDSVGIKGYVISYSSSYQTIIFDTYASDGSVRDALQSTIKIADTGWHYIMGIWDGTTDTNGKELYIDGMLVGQKTSSISVVGSGSYAFQVSSSLGSWRPLNGTVDEVRVSNTARSADWIAAEYGNEFSPSTFTSLSPQQSLSTPSLDHFHITGSSSQSSGSSQTITITAIDYEGNTLSSYSGDKQITFSGADAVGNNIPAATNNNGNSIPFGSDTAITFTNGIAHTNITLYKAETAGIGIKDNDNYSSSGYNLPVTVSPQNGITSIGINTPLFAVSNNSFSLTLFTQDTYGNTINNPITPVTLSTDKGTISPSSINPASFTSGTYTGDFTISDITQNTDVIITAQYGSVTSSVTIPARGIAQMDHFAITKSDLQTTDADIIIGKTKETNTPNFFFTGDYADDSACIQAALDSAQSGDTVLIRQGDYQIARQVSQTGKDLNIIGEGDVKMHIGFEDADVAAFRFRGTQITQSILSLNAGKGTNVVQLQDASNISPGDIIRIYNDTLWEPNYYPNLKTGETYIVKDILGKAVVLEEGLLRDYPVALNSGALVYRPIKINVQNILFYGTGSEGTSVGLQLQFCKDSSVSQCYFNDIGNRSLAVYTCANVDIGNNTMLNSNLTGLGYGVNVADGGFNVRIHDNLMRNCRHVVAVSGAPIYGENRDVYVYNNIFYQDDGKSNVVDAHQMTINYFVMGNTINASTYSAFGNGAQYSIFANNIIRGGLAAVTKRGVTNNTVQIVTRNTILNTPLVYGGFPNTKELYLSDNYVLGNPDDYAVYSPSTGVQNLTAQNNKIIGTLYPFYITIPSSFVSNITISGNQISNPQRSAVFISYASTSSGTLNLYNNTIHNPSLSGAGSNAIELYNVQNSLIAGNRITDDNHHTLYGIYEDSNSSNNNIFQNASSGLLGQTLFSQSSNTNLNTSAIPTDTPILYPLTVINGTGTGSYSVGEEVNITANIPQDKIFDKWTGDIGYISDIHSPNAIATLPQESITLIPTYKDIDQINKGEAVTINIRAISTGKDSYVDYSGDKQVVFSGANKDGEGKNAIRPTATDKDGKDIPFGQSTTITFRSGIATSNIKLYKGETAYINITDGTYTSFNDQTYSFPLAVQTENSSTPSLPPKPSAQDMSAIFKDGAISLSNLPNTIKQIAVSLTNDFIHSSWIAIEDMENILKSYTNTDKLYIKLRTDTGAVSDTITYSPTSNTGTTTLQDGDIVKTPSSPDIYVIKIQNSKKYKRLILSPHVFNSYQHLKWENIKTISEEQLNQYQTSNLVKEATDTIIYTLTPNGDQGQRKPFDITQTYDPDSIYTINKVDRDSYEWEE